MIMEYNEGFYGFWKSISMYQTAYQRRDTKVNAGVGAFDTLFDTFYPSKKYLIHIKLESEEST